jgi:hypothetical protein
MFCNGFIWTLEDKIVVPTGRLTNGGLIAALLLVARVASAQGTTTFLSNIGQSSSGSLSVGSDSWLAAEFVTGINASGYFLDSIQLGMANSIGNPSDFTVMLYANEGPGGASVGNSLGTFIGSLDPSTSGTYTYTAPVSLALSTRGTYYIVVTAGTAVAAGSYEWSYASADDYNPNNSWEGSALFESVNGSTWTTPPSEALQFALIGSVAPEPGVVGLLAVGGLGMMWWTKRARGARLGARGKKV